MLKKTLLFFIAILHPLGLHAQDFLNVTYDRSSSITLVEDGVHGGFDVDFTLDGQDRLTRAEEGTWSGSAITSRTRDEQWTRFHKER